jgi:hypothetical protein
MTIATIAVTTLTGNVYVSGGNTAITSLTLCNWGPSNVTANLHVVPSSASATTTNQMLVGLSLASGDTYQIYAAGEKLLLGPGDSVQVVATANTVSAVTSYTTI